MKHPRQTVVDVLREVAECAEKHRSESLREYFEKKLPGLPTETMAVIEAAVFKEQQAAREAYAALLQRFENGEIDLDEYCRQTLLQAAEAGERSGPGIFAAMDAALEGR